MMPMARNRRKVMFKNWSCGSFPYCIANPSWATTTQLIAQRPINKNTRISSVLLFVVSERERSDRPFLPSYWFSTVPHPWSASNLLGPIILRLEDEYEHCNANGTLLSSHHQQTIVSLVTSGQFQVRHIIFAPFLSEFCKKKCPVYPIELQVHTLAGTPRALPYKSQ